MGNSLKNNKLLKCWENVRFISSLVRLRQQVMMRQASEDRHSGTSSWLGCIKVFKRNIGNLIKVHNQINKSFVGGLRRKYHD